ncbi:conserved hypothetical protein [Leishmania major strain Friedlin]|uniref:Uncharacterized protein n=1 Tax=Leishmania major TaxID=5664 RepID=Q4Q5C1_LEIMA|nr:conserved hypothetical protein [Leishmania major strain Friedlin]CAG9580253.1 hypothetical_protein_-_conserved [Leishmania major strain Friedlin]CAJ08681.1 conserved hypothetical protein [Leishmania major strain Friedlin]|eukprot:XP_001685477.1 conserved hypothetical protein [Leishmania major strain Friedlin]
MSDAFEARMSAMRARLSSLCHTVEEQEVEQQQQRRSFEHRYFVEARAAGSAATPAATKPITSTATPPSSAPISRPVTSKSQVPRTDGISERDVNQVHSASRKDAAFGHHFGTSSPSASITRARAAKPGSGVNAMLQLARYHASGSWSEAVVTKDIVRFTGGRSSPVPKAPATIPPEAFAVNTGQDTTDSSPVPLMPCGVAGLHSYGFRERLPSPRRPTASLAANTVDLASRNGEGRTSQNTPREESCITAADTTIVDTMHADEATSFDAFRVVQERLRQKMMQLTTTSPHSVVPLSTRGAPAEFAVSDDATAPREELPHRGLTASRAVSDVDGSSPSPRPPPGTRAETATPTRSPDKDESSSHETAPLPQTTPRYQHGQGDTWTDVEVLPATTEPDTENATEARLFTHGSLHDSVVGSGDETTAVSREWQWSRCGVPSTKARTANVPRGVFDPTVRHVRVSRMPSSDAQLNPAAGEQRADSREYRRSPEAATAGRAHSDRGRSGRTTASIQHGVSSAPRRSGSRHAPSSTSAARWSATREGSVSTAARSRKSAPKPAARPKPISLNVEATILCPVTGAELFALLRMRGLIDSEGDTAEYRLPPVRCHRLYVTAEEHRQLKLLRQSLHSLVAEEQHQDIPSYQRFTVSARSRNAEFAPPPPVLRYMDV